MNLFLRTIPLFLLLVCMGKEYAAVSTQPATLHHGSVHGIKKLASSDWNRIPQDGIAVVDYYATWCNPCVKMLPTFLQVAQEMQNNVRFFTCEADNTVFKGRNISTIPCIILFKDGKEVKRTGSLSKKELEQWIAEEVE